MKSQGLHTKSRWRTFGGKTVFGIVIRDPGDYIGKHRKEA